MSDSIEVDEIAHIPEELVEMASNINELRGRAWELWFLVNKELHRIVTERNPDVWAKHKRELVKRWREMLGI